MTVLTLQKNDIYIEFINTLIDNGWKGKWEIIGDEIKIHHTAGTLQTMKGNLDYHQALQLSMCLAIQLAYLHSINNSILFFSKDDVTIIDNEWFIITNLERMVPIIEKIPCYSHSLFLYRDFSPRKWKIFLNCPLKQIFLVVIIV